MVAEFFINPEQRPDRSRGINRKIVKHCKLFAISLKKHKSPDIPNYLTPIKRIIDVLNIGYPVERFFFLFFCIFFRWERRRVVRIIFSLCHISIIIIFINFNERTGRSRRAVQSRARHINNIFYVVERFIFVPVGN